jgi:cell division protein FtsA
MNRLTNWLLDKPRPSQGDVFAALDIGTSKIACFIARADETSRPRVIGIGHQLAEGVRGGLVADMEAVQRAIASAVATAEQMAGENIERVIVNVAAPLLLSQTASIELPLNGRAISATDLDRTLAQGQTMVAADAQGHMLELIHTIPVQYTLDGQKGIRDPSGMIGNNLQTQLHLVSAAFGPVRTLVTAVARCHLEVERLVASPYASGMACLVEDEMDLGCTVIDIGAGTTTIGIFFDGHLIFADGFAVGGAHITNDVARGLTTSLSHAERLKTLYGSAISGPLDDREIIDVPQVGEEEPEFANHIPKSHLIGIVQPRLEEIFEMVRVRLDKSGLIEMAGRRVVLTGGTSQMPGIRDVAQRILDKQVRLGRPLRITRPTLSAAAREDGVTFTGLAEATSGPAFATTAGLLAVAMQPDLTAVRSGMDYGTGGLFSRMGQWVRQNL